MAKPAHVKTKATASGGMIDQELKPLCDEYAQLHADKDRLEAEMTQLSTRMSQISDELCEKFGRMGLSSAKMEGLGIFFVANTARPRVIDEEALFSDLRRRGLGSLIKEGVHNQTLSSALKEARDNGEPDFAGIDIYEQQAIRMRKS